MVSLNSSRCFPTISGPRKLVNPVTFPPGRPRLATSPNPTGSRTVPMTMGIVAVAFLAARAAGVAGAHITSIWSRTSSAARAGSRPYRPSAERYSMTTV